MYYVLAQLTITNMSAYQQYVGRFTSVFEGSHRRLLAADKTPNLIEGRWIGDRIVLLSFADEVQFRQWWESPEYRDIATLRRAGATGPILGIRGLG